MTILNFPTARASKSSALDRIIAEEGAPKVLIAALTAMLKRPSQPMDARDLPDHLLRDIGLKQKGISNPYGRGR